MKSAFVTSFIICFFLTQTARSAITLDTSFKAALTKSEVLRQNQEQLSQAEARIDQLVGGIYPNFGFTLSHTIQPQPPDPIAQQFSPAHQTTANFTVTQPIFKGLREWNGLSRLKSLQSAQEASLEQAQNDLFLELAANYLQILGFEQDLKNLQEQSTLYENRVKELNSRVHRGESNQTDLVTAESTYASLLAEIGLTEGQLEVSREMFRFLTGLEGRPELVDPEIDRKVPLESVDKYLARAEKRPDIQEAQRRLSASESMVSVAWGAHWPSVDAVGNYYVTRPGFLSDLKWDIGVKLTIPLFEGGASQARITEAVSQKKEATLALERVRRAATQEIRSIHGRLAARFNQMKNLQRSTELSKKNTELLQRDYRRGLAKNIDVQLALTEFRISQRSLDQAHFATELDLIRLQIAAAMTPTSMKEDKP